MKKIRIGQIGIGHNHGSGKMAAFRKFPDLFEVVGVSESDPAWRKERGALPCYQGLPFMSEDELIEQCDAIVIETDVWRMLQTAKKCVAAGKHIHMDKPANGSYEDYKAVLGAAKEKELVFQLGYMYRYNPAIIKCMEAIKSGELGEILTINAEMNTAHSAEYRLWLKRFKGGIMYILGSHLIDLIVYILGEPKNIVSFLKRTELDRIDVEDHNFAVLEYDKAIARVTANSFQINGWGQRQFVVSGTKGTMEIKPIELTAHMTLANLNISTNSYADMHKDVEVADVPTHVRYDEMVKDFYAYAVKEKENPFSYEHELLVHRVIAKVCGGYNDKEEGNV